MNFDPPKGFVRFLARLPILVYRAGFGRFLGDRFLMLYHLGRKSGKTRKVVLEVLRHEPADGSYLIASGWGERADWYKNLRAHKVTEIEVGGQKKSVMASFLSDDQARQELEIYAQKHPWACRMLFILFKDEETRSWADMANRFKLVRLLRYAA